MKRIIGTVLMLFAISQPALADFNEGVVAYLMGEYDKAFTTMQSLSETTDHGLAQYYLGMMYLKGQGTTQDYEEASKWLRASAENGIAQAQYNLARLYMEGQGVPRDYEFAYIWFKTGAAHGHDASVRGIPNAEENLTEEQLADAGELANEYIEKYGPKDEDSDGIRQVPNE